MLLPKEEKAWIRWFSLFISFVGLVIGLKFYFDYDIAKAGYQFGWTLPWIPQFGIQFKTGVDGINLPLVVLTGFIAFTGVLFSWNIEERIKEFFAFFFILIGGVYGFFQSLDLFLLFVFYEIAIVPKYFIIAIWGSTRKEYGAMKLVLYSFVGSTLVFIGILALYYVAELPQRTFDLEMLATARFPLSFQIWVFPLIFLGFATLAGMWPFHTWAPTGHVAAPTAASMLLAGVVMKLGAYGCLRVAIMLFSAGMNATISIPLPTIDFLQFWKWGSEAQFWRWIEIPQFWRWTIAILATINIFYGAMVALVQRDFKFVIGYSSVSHMGFVLLGLVVLNVTGLTGAVMQMFSHGMIAGLLFAVVGRMVYDRTHTRELSELGGLWKALPWVGWVFILGGLASMGLPGSSGFLAEFWVLMGTWKSFPWLLIFIGLGMIVTVTYTLRTIHKAFFGDRRSDLTKWSQFPPITVPEKIGSIILVSLIFIIGIYPPIMMNMVEKSCYRFLTQLHPNPLTHTVSR